MNSHMIDEATTGVVAVVRPKAACSAATRRFVGARAGVSVAFHRTQTPVFAALNEGSSAPIGALAVTRSIDKNVVITQDPYHRVSGKQLWSHPPV